ncbi:carbohydrate-binding domain-containing protein [Rhodopila sp.]|uniref:carbohydrate-binding domain-containing protein n=1 Tax=Rhodopila sp. TaxID=2480087 RepID=UPI003D0D8DD7
MSGSTSSGNIYNSGSVIGSGSDSIVLNVAEDQALGVNANFTVNVDGQQIGGIQTATASQSSGQAEQFTFEGNYGVGQHNVTVTFTNNFIYPVINADGSLSTNTGAGDRNLYVDGVSYNGQTVSNTTTPIYVSPGFPPNSNTVEPGNAVFKVNDTTPVPSGSSPNPTTTPGPVYVGSGPDTLVLNMAEDAYNGDAQFTVSVDGQQVGGTQTTTAEVSEGQQQAFNLQGNWGGGTHTVAVTFTNDGVGGYYPGTNLGLDTADRNLYVMGASLDGGASASGPPWEQATDGTYTFNVTAGSNPGAGASSSSTTATPAATTASTDSTTSNNATITASSLASGQASTGSSSGMSFVSTPTTSASGSSGGSSSSGTSTDTTPATVASVTSGTSTSSQDYTVPSAGGSSDSSGGTGSTGGGGWSWSNQHDAGGNWAAYHQQS